MSIFDSTVPSSQSRAGGGKVLTMPVPVPFCDGQPWESIIESAEPNILSVVSEVSARFDHWELKADREYLLIHGDFWQVLDRKSANSYLVTYDGWDMRGFTWTLQRIEVPASEAPASLCCHSKGGRLINESDLIAEAEFYCQAWYSKLEEAVSGEAKTNAKQLSGAVSLPTRSLRQKFMQALALKEQEEAKAEIQQRQTVGLPLLPTHEEREAWIAKFINNILDDDWVVRDGRLFYRCWQMQRATPNLMSNAETS